MNEAEYRADPRPSITQLAKLDRMTPAHAWVEWAKLPSKSMQFGTAFHTLVLEPHKFNELVVVAPPPINPRTGEPYGVGTKAHDEWAAEHSVPGKTLITTAQHEVMEQMAASVFGLDIALVLRWPDPINAIEQPLFGEIAGVECKGKPDLCCNARLGDFAPLILDLKTTSGKATPEEFQRSLVDYGYAFQATGYSMLYERQHREWLCQFIFVVVESEPPYAAAAFRLDRKVIEWFRPRVERAARIWQEGVFTEAYPETTQTIGMPRWHEASRSLVATRSDQSISEEQAR
jgi:hypothetical protein